MNVRWDRLCTWPGINSLISDLPRIVSALTRSDRVANFKIGISGDPEKRAEEYEDEGIYDEMVVLYKTESERFVRDGERFLIDRYRDVCENTIGGGGGRLSGPPYYLYVVVRRHW